MAVFVAEGLPTHMARQLASGQWTSKLGKSVDIEHELHALAGERYGEVVRVLARPVAPSSSPRATLSG